MAHHPLQALDVRHWKKTHALHSGFAGGEFRNGASYFGSSAGFGSTGFCSAASSFFWRLSQPYFFWNFSTRPVVSMNFILPVKNGCEALEMSRRTTGYSFPSVHFMVSLLFTVERVRNEKL